MFATTVSCLGTLRLGRLGRSYLPLGHTCTSMIRRSPGGARCNCMGTTFLRPSSRRGCARRALLTLKRRMRQLLRRNMALGSVAVLIHGGGGVPPVTSCFSGRLRLSIISSRTFHLSTSLTVYVLVSTLHYLSGPRGEVTRTTLVRGCGLRVAGSRRPGFAATAPLPRTFASQQRALHLVPLCRLLRRLFDVFNVDHVRGRSTCLFSFFSTIARCLRDGSSRLSDFVHC